MYDDVKEKQAAFTECCRAEMGATMVKIILCDDNQIFLENLRKEVRAILRRNNVDSEIHIFNSLETIRPDLIPKANVFFLDIDFAQRQYNGIDIAKKIRCLNEQAVIIFVTNYIQYAPEGYEVQAFRYLLKSSISTNLERCLQQALDKLSVNNETLMITVSGETIILSLKDILYIESQAHNIVINVLPTASECLKQYRLYATLSSMEQQLGERGFLRIQKSYLVNMRRLTKYQCTEAVLDNGLSLKVSQKIYNAQKKKFLLWKGRQ